MGFLKSSFIVSVGTLSSRVFGFIRDLLIARFLGAGINSDILFIGLRIPNTFRQIFGEGAFNLAFVPLFKQYCDDNDVNPKALKFLEETFSIFMLAILTILVLSEIFMPQIVSVVAPGLVDKGPEVFDLAVSISRVLMPYILFVSYMTFMGAVLNSLGRFAAMAFAPALVNIGYILAFGFVYFTSLEVGNMTYVPAFGMVFGGFLQFLLMHFAIKRLPFKIHFKKPKLSPETKLLFRRFVPTVLGSGIVILNGLVSVFLASSLEKGAVSYMFYSDRLIQLPTGLFATAIATVLLPTLTQRIKLKQDVNEAFILVFGISLAISAFCFSYMYLYSDIIINTLFERGEFTRLATEKTGAALALMAFAIPAIMNLKIISIIFYSQGNTKLPTIISAGSFLLNLGLCLVFMDKYGYLGLILAGVISVYFTVIVQLVIVIAKKVLKLSNVLRLMGIYAVIQAALLYLMPIINNLWNISFDSGIIYKLVYLFIMGLVGIAITLVFVYVFKMHKVKY